MGDSPSCPDSETLAAYIDGQVDADTRRFVETHAADCDICASVLAATYLDVLQATAPNAPAAPVAPPERLKSTSRRTLGIAATLAAAAALLAAIWINDDGATGPSSETHLASMAQATDPVRIVEGRLPEFEYRRFVPQSRSARAANRSEAVAAAAITLEELPANSRAPDVLYTRGVAQLMLNDLDASARELSAALELNPSDVRVLNALAVVHLARAAYSGAKSDLESALEVAERAIRVDATDPVAHFNSALALERLGRIETAVDRWRQVLRLDRTEWASEAQGRLTKLTGGGTR